MFIFLINSRNPISSQSACDKSTLFTHAISAKMCAEKWFRTSDNVSEITTLVQCHETPFFLHHFETITKRTTELKELTAVDRIFYAMKANDHEEILRHISSMQ